MASVADSWFPECHSQKCCPNDPLTAPLSASAVSTDTDCSCSNSPLRQGTAEVEVVSRPLSGKLQNRRKLRGRQGRFLGRLVAQEDEGKLEEECVRLSPLVAGHGLKRAHSSPLANLVLGIASGHVRKHCQSQERLLQELQAQLQHMQAMRESAERMLQQENASLRVTLQLYDSLEQTCLRSTATA